MKIIHISMGWDTDVVSDETAQIILQRLPSTLYNALLDIECLVPIASYEVIRENSGRPLIEGYNFLITIQFDVHKSLLERLKVNPADITDVAVRGLFPTLVGGTEIKHKITTTR